MADIDFITVLENGFEISITNSPRGVSGNRALLNRFEITFITMRKTFAYDGTNVVDNYGGNAERIINVPRVLADSNAIAATVSLCVDLTVESMKKNEPDNLPDTERIDRAELLDIQTVQDIVTARIQVFPVEAETYEALQFNLPIIRGDN